MTARWVRLREVCARLAIDEALLREVREEGLVEIKHATDDENEVMSADDAERLRLIALLMREMDVNMAGVEVILHLREDMLAMRRQFDEIMRAMVEEMRRRLEK